jgi:N-acetylneuraminate synthase
VGTIFLPEVGLNHDGSLAIALAYVRQLAADGASVVKFQCHLPEFEPWQVWRPSTSVVVTQGRDRLDYLAETAFSQDQWRTIRDECHRLGLRFACSVFCAEGVDYLDGIVDLWKIPHPLVMNAAIHEAIGGRPVLVSTRREDALAASRLWGPTATMLICDGAYPSSLELIRDLIRHEMEFQPSRGLSYHYPSAKPLSWAVMAGLPYVEAHVIFSRQTPVPDAPWSLEPDQWRAAIQATKVGEEAA